MADDGLDAFIVSYAPNIRYLTGFSGSAATVLLAHHETVLFTDFRYRDQVEEEVGGSVQAEIVQRDVVGHVFDRASARGCRTLGYEAHIISADEARRWGEREGPRELEPRVDWVETLRSSKDGDEVSSIRTAATLASSALEVTLERVAVGMREIDVAVILESELRRRGSEWHPFETIVASGPRAALPHARTTERVIGRGEWLLIDFGARVDGYCADITRTVVVGGKPDDRQRAMYELVQNAQQSALKGIRAGMTGEDADALARRVIETRGFGDSFGHSLGHGLGLEVHEAPRVAKSNPRPLPDAAVVTIEPGVYFPGWGGVRLEDDVYLTASGAELLSDGKTQLREIV